MKNRPVLVIERDAAEAEKIAAFLRRNGFRGKIDVVADKGEAMEYVFHIGRYASSPDHEAPGLVLLDLQTDRTPHVVLLKPLHFYLRTAEVPIVILTSTEAQEKEIAVHQLGKVEVVRKPLNGIAFGEAIQRLGIR